jgi:antitoxin (DNA-binding transcriptional repressor) of toxin-antitoxin stability system
MTIEFTQLPKELQDAIARGESITVTRAGRKSARLVISEDEPASIPAQQKIDALRSWVKDFARTTNKPVVADRDSFYKEGHSF